ncbi:MAG: MOSC domain-containing protein [Rhizobiales bacterium]|nr:MOSC domain-containing protein [Hyphomicrobiales bacterium]
MAQDHASGGRVVGRVRDIRRYPVSSMGGELLTEAEVESGGLAGDRKIGLFATETGEVAAPGRHRHWRPLANVLARLGRDGVEISLDRATWIGAEQGALALSAYLGFRVEFRAYDGTEQARSLYELSPIHLLTTSSMAALQRILPDATIDARRFRCNLVIETQAGAEPVEQAWLGKRLSIGGVVLEGSEPCARCAFTSLAQEPDLPFDKRVHTAISQRLDGNLGLYCSVIEPGRLRVGDEIVLAEFNASRPSG